MINQKLAHLAPKLDEEYSTLGNEFASIRLDLCVKGSQR